MSADGYLSAVRKTVPIFGIEKRRKHHIEGAALGRPGRPSGHAGDRRNTRINPNRPFINLNHKDDLRWIRDGCEAFQDFDSIEALCGLETGGCLGQQLL